MMHSPSVRKVIVPCSKLWPEMIIRLLLIICICVVEKQAPFKRVIQPEELWLYRYPRTADYVPLHVLLTAGIALPVTVFFLRSLFTSDRRDLSRSLWSFSIALLLNILLTGLLKVVSGRPRPDYYFRCFPNGEGKLDDDCTGNVHEVWEGRKSFPSGHSSFAFVSMGFLSLYLAGKLELFTEKSQGQSWRLVVCLLPLVSATLTAISRTCDYHHHWQDALVGSGIGLGLAYLCYRQYFPPLDYNAASLHSTSKKLPGIQSQSEMHSNVNKSEVKPLLDAEDNNIKLI